MDLPELNKRIRDIIENKADGNVKKFSELIDISQQKVNRLFNIDTRTGNYPSVPSDILTCITELFVDIDPRWLLTGHVSIKNKSVAIPDEGNGTPLVEIEAVGGFGNDNFSISKEDIIERYIIPDFDHASFMIRVRGDSMSPRYNSGDLVACKILRESQFIQWNEVHVIATKEQGILIKRLRKGSNEKTLLAVSENVDYSPFEIPRDEITGIAFVLGGIRLE